MLQAADLTIRLHPDDDVVIARVEIPGGTLLAAVGALDGHNRIGSVGQRRSGHDPHGFTRVHFMMPTRARR